MWWLNGRKQKECCVSRDNGSVEMNIVYDWGTRIEMNVVYE
jgi:hypothetical protein